MTALFHYRNYSFVAERQLSKIPCEELLGDYEIKTTIVWTVPTCVVVQGNCKPLLSLGKTTPIGWVLHAPHAILGSKYI